MQDKDLNYYGVSRQTYETCRKLISQANRKNSLALAIWFLAVNVLYLIFSSFNLFGASKENALYYVAFVAIAAICILLLTLFPAFCEKHSVFFVYLCFSIGQLYGITLSILQIYIPATMFLLFLALSSVTYIDRLYPMALAMLATSALFVFSSFYFKTFSIAYYDTYNAIIVLVLAVGLHYMFQRLRLQQFVLSLRDAQIQRELEIKSSFDSLSGLFNRARFFSFTEMAYKAHKGGYMALAVIDLDSFKHINDNYGHQIGDKVIQLTGRTILTTLELPPIENFDIGEWKATNILPIAGRLGGDEFIVAILNKKNREEVQALFESLLARLNAIRIDNTQLAGIQASIGIAENMSEDLDLDSAYKRADEALYASKRAGKNRISFA